MYTFVLTDLHMGEIVVQKISKEYPLIQKGITYYSIINSVNNLSLTSREIELLAYTNKRGNIASATAKQEFTRLFDSSVATVNNMISKLHSKRLLVKENKRIFVNPVISLDQSKDIMITITLKLKDEQPS